MSIERVSDFLNNSPHSQSLMRIYLAHKLEKYVTDEFDEQTKVVFVNNTYTIYCTNAPQAQFLRGKIGKLRAQIAEGFKIIVKI
ncbi:hypothetical protein HY844_02575 [Candidatus Berkelbacteria bacterium]|nr:hypothetical protein [Candidatus Berkelbacteria bacterium]